MKNAIKLLIIFAAVAIIRIGTRTEICKGICLDESGNGKVYNGEPIYNYISYSYTDATAGDELITYELLNPLNNYCDDIVLRIDYNTTTKNFSLN